MPPTTPSALCIINAGIIEVDADTAAGSATAARVLYDSDYESGSESETSSLLSSAAVAHTFENGRRYHAAMSTGRPRYYLPNDQPEIDGMDLHHHYLRLALQGALYTAPIRELNPQRILDLGTGTGMWCIDMGDEFPAAEVIGVDLSPIQPTWVPPNVRFEVDDIEDLWTWPENYFDYIHIRSMAGMFSDWNHVVASAFRALRPGGYLEIQDTYDFFASDDGSVPSDAPVRRWLTVLSEALSSVSIPWLDVPSFVSPLMRSHGFEEPVVARNIKVPLGPWPRDHNMKILGLYARKMKFDRCEGFTLALCTRVHRWRQEDVHGFVEDVKRDLCRPDYHAYERFFCIYARKPE